MLELGHTIRQTYVVGHQQITMLPADVNIFPIHSVIICTWDTTIRTYPSSNRSIIRLTHAHSWTGTSPNKTYNRELFLTHKMRTYSHTYALDGPTQHYNKCSRLCSTLNQCSTFFCWVWPVAGWRGLLSYIVWESSEKLCLNSVFITSPVA